MIRLAALANLAVDRLASISFVEAEMLGLEAKISKQTLMGMEQPPPTASLIDEASADES